MDAMEDCISPEQIHRPNLSNSSRISIEHYILRNIHNYDLQSNANHFFVFHRIYAIWGYNKRLLQFLIPPYVCVYATAVALSIHTILHDFLHLTSYLGPPFNECAFETRPIQLVVVWSLLVILDVYLVVLAGWNILERPRETNTVIVRQLFNDGLGYFAISLTLRIFNIIVIAKLNLAYATLSVVYAISYGQAGV